jgi:hypothetical protein
VGEVGRRQPRGLGAGEGLPKGVDAAPGGPILARARIRRIVAAANLVAEPDRVTVKAAMPPARILPGRPHHADPAPRR